MSAAQCLPACLQSARCRRGLPVLGWVQAAAHDVDGGTAEAWRWGCELCAQAACDLAPRVPCPVANPVCGSEAASRTFLAALAPSHRLRLLSLVSSQLAAADDEKC